MKKLLCIAVLFAGYSYPLPFYKKALRTITNGALYAIASSDASQETTEKARALLEKVAPSKELLAVRNFNWLGRFMFGDYSTVAIPYLNYVIVDDSNMENLSEEAQRFALGRCMMTLRSSHKYTALKYLIPALGNELLGKLLTEKEKESIEYAKNSRKEYAFLKEQRNNHTLSEKERTEIQQRQREICKSVLFKSLPFFGKTAAVKSITGYLARSIEYELDTLTATQLTCKDGALEYLQKVEQQPLIHLLATIGLIIAANKIKDYSDNTETYVAYLHKPISLGIKAIKYLPGQNTSYFKTGFGYLFGSLGRKVPVLHWLSFMGTQPYAYRRIDKLNKKIG